MNTKHAKSITGSIRISTLMDSSIEPMNIPALEISEAFQKQLNAIIELEKAIMKQYQPFLNLTQNISDIQDSIKPIAKSVFDLSSLGVSKSLRDLTLTLKSILDSPFFKQYRFDKETLDAFRDAGWPVAPSMSPSLRKRIVELHHQGKRKFASQVIIGYYHRNSYKILRKTVESWKEHRLFIPRMHILNSALDAHCRKQYILSVPSLLPQIEGILSDFAKENSLDVRYGKIQKVYNTAIDAANKNSDWVIVGALTFLLENNIYSFTDFNQEINRPFQKRKLTRHTILHGLSVNYNKSAMSLKGFLILDAIFDLRPPSTLKLGQEGQAIT
jgi:hypothetical protein